jgi:hypothetical protein
MVIETRDLAEGVIASAMGVAGQIPEGFELSENCEVDGGAEDLLQSVKRSHLVP